MNDKDKNNDSVIIYTDGACSGNPGPGGYAAIIIGENNKKEIAGFHSNTTNNRMELMAVIAGLENVQKGTKVKLFSDSNYVIKGITNWIYRKKKKGWKTSSNNNVKNKELRKRLDNLINDYKIEFIKVRGHSGNEYNEEADSLAKKQIRINEFIT